MNYFLAIEKSVQEGWKEKEIKGGKCSDVKKIYKITKASCGFILSIIYGEKEISIIECEE
jgi:hypothetical protein